LASPAGASVLCRKTGPAGNGISHAPGRECDRSGALSHLFLSGGTAVFQTVDELARKVCYSTRQLNRVVQDLYGISAEELTTYKKFMESVRLIHAEEGSLTGVAYSAGFYDQAHFAGHLNPSPASHPVNTGNKKAFSLFTSSPDSRYTKMLFNCLLFVVSIHLHHA
jgi:AraC-like DNA-binding protein